MPNLNLPVCIAMLFADLNLLALAGHVAHVGFGALATYMSVDQVRVRPLA